MTDECEHTRDCGFFLKFGERKSNLWRGLVSFYCQGRGFNLCERRRKYLNNIVSISDDIMPTGQEASKAFLSLN